MDSAQNTPASRYAGSDGRHHILDINCSRVRSDVRSAAREPNLIMAFARREIDPVPDLRDGGGPSLLALSPSISFVPKGLRWKLLQ